MDEKVIKNKISSQENTKVFKIEPRNKQSIALQKNTEKEETINLSSWDRSEENTEAFIEPICNPHLKRYTLFPIQYPEIWAFYKKHESTFWTVEEVDLDTDLSDFRSLNKNEQYFIKNVLAFFASSDVIVNENLLERFSNEVQILEAKCFYGFQIAIENIHSEMYSKLIEYLCPKEEHHNLFNAIESIPCVKRKAEWALKWINSSEDFDTRCVAFACIEGLFFSGSFAAIFWIKKRGLMKGLTFSNELISRDEGLHTDFACLLHNKYIKRKCQRVTQIIREAVDIEKEFLTESLPVNLIGMNCEMMKEYIEYVADRLAYALGEKKIYNTENPFDFMDNISLQGKTNFFDKKEANYQKTFVGIENKGYNFKLDDDF